MLHLKLFHTQNTEECIGKLKILLQDGEKRIFSINENVIAADYFGDSHEYINVVKMGKASDLTQFMITSSKFLSIIKYVVMNKYDLEKVDFIYPISEESSNFINAQIGAIYSFDEDKELVKSHLSKLLAEIEWLATDDCIDIKSVSFDYQNPKDGIYRKIVIYSNGVISLNSEEDIEVLRDILINMRY